MAQGGSTGYAINPARDFGPRLAHFLLPIKGKGNSNWAYSWIPVVGPIIGGGAGAAFYYLAFEETFPLLGWVAIALFAITVIYAIQEEAKK